MNSLAANWKTTLQGLLTGLIGLSAVAPALSFLPPKQAGILVSSGVIAKVILGVFQKDAGTTLAVTPASPATPIPVPSHEVPDSPSATPVVGIKQ